MGTSQDKTPRQWLEISDGELLDHCDIDLYRASGPGGQHRNKTSSAVRLRHRTTGLIVTAVESRSQHENKSRAVKRMREAIALKLRNPVPADAHPEFYKRALSRDPSLHMSPKNPEYPLVIQYALDVLFAEQAAVAPAAARLGISTGQLIRFLKEDPGAWEQANLLRKEFKLANLR